jgi:hypothetical protein
VTKLNPAGTALVYSTYLGGSGGEFGLAIAVDGPRRAHVTGETPSTDFPTEPSPGAYDETLGGSFDAFVTRLNAAGTALVYSTYLGGSDIESGSGIAVDPPGRAYVTGNTCSADFPTEPSPGAYDETFGGVLIPCELFPGFPGDAFVTKFERG